MFYVIHRRHVLSYPLLLLLLLQRYAFLSSTATPLLVMGIPTNIYKSIPPTSPIAPPLERHPTRLQTPPLRIQIIYLPRVVSQRWILKPLCHYCCQTQPGLRVSHPFTPRYGQHRTYRKHEGHEDVEQIEKHKGYEWRSRYARYLSCYTARDVQWWYRLDDARGDGDESLVVDCSETCGEVRAGRGSCEAGYDTGIELLVSPFCKIQNVFKLR